MINNTLMSAPSEKTDVLTQAHFPIGENITIAYKLVREDGSMSPVFNLALPNEYNNLLPLIEANYEIPFIEYKNQTEQEVSEMRATIVATIHSMFSRFTPENAHIVAVYNKSKYAN